MNFEHVSPLGQAVPCGGLEVLGDARGKRPQHELSYLGPVTLRNTGQGEILQIDQPSLTGVLLDERPRPLGYGA